MMTAYTLVWGRQAVIIVTNCKYPTFLAFTQEKRKVSLLNFCLLKNMNFKPLVSLVRFLEAPPFKN